MTPPDRSSSMNAVSTGLSTVRLAASVAPPARGFLSAVGQLGRMYTDARYRVSPLGRVGAVAIIAAAVANYAFWNYLLPVPILATIAERGILAGLAIGLYLILSRELERYRKVLDYLAKYG